MRTDVVLAGVGGQGVLTVAALLAEAARREGLVVKQGEVHGMAQRGGAVQATLRLADGPIAADLVPRGSADLLLALEPVEALRHAGYLRPGGRLVTAAESHENVPDYPPLDDVHARVRAVPGAVLVPATDLAREAGSIRVVNVVMVGAASPWLPLSPDMLEGCVMDAFSAKGERVVEANRRAFFAGREAAGVSG